MAQHYLLCPLNHGLKNLQELLIRRLDEYAIDGIAFHSTCTCRAMTNPQSMLAKAAERERGVKSFFFEGDVADASFYNDEMFDSRLEAMLEAIDVQRMKTLLLVRDDPIERSFGMTAGNWFVMGVDLGSTTAKATVVDQDGVLRGASVVQMGAVSRDAVVRAMEQALSAADVDRENTRRIVSTGYGRKLVPGAARSFTEITCHARGRPRCIRVFDW